MSDQIETHRVQHYSSGIELLAQQRMSRFQGRVRMETGQTGKVSFFDQAGTTSMVAKAARHSPTSHVVVPMERRAVFHNYRETAEFVDRNDLTTVLNDPMGVIGRAQAAAYARTRDQFVADAFFAAAMTGENGSTSTAFDTTNYSIAAGGAGLNTTKLIQARNILEAGEIDESEPLYCATTSKQRTLNLLSDTEARNSDYNTVKALVQGEINTWLGFDFGPRFEGMPKVISDRYVACYGKMAMLYVERDFRVRVDEMPGNSYMWQIFLSAEMGATRMNETGVVRVLCQE